MCLLQFLGKWYEVTWIPPEYQDAGNAWINYYHVYSMDHFGLRTSYYSGK
jgi:lipocalin